VDKKKGQLKIAQKKEGAKKKTGEKRGRKTPVDYENKSFFGLHGAGASR